MGNGQCMAIRRRTLLDAGGFGPVAHHTVEDVALVRTMASAGFAVGFLDASDLLTVRMYESARDAWRGWGRSLSLPGVDRLPRRLADLVVVASAQALPAGAAGGTGAPTPSTPSCWPPASAPWPAPPGRTDPRGPAYWLSPAADLVAVAALAWPIVTRRHRWRGRTYR